MRFLLGGGAPRLRARLVDGVDRGFGDALPAAEPGIHRDGTDRLLAGTVAERHGPVLGHRRGQADPRHIALPARHPPSPNTGQAGRLSPPTAPRRPRPPPSSSGSQRPLVRSSIFLPWTYGSWHAAFAGRFSQPNLVMWRPDGGFMWSRRTPARQANRAARCTAPCSAPPILHMATTATPPARQLRVVHCDRKRPRKQNRSTV